MHAATLRRLLVLGVCAAGVSCLYLVPGLSRAPQQTARPLRYDGPTARPSASAVRGATASATASAARSAVVASATATPDRAATTDASATTDEPEPAAAPTAEAGDPHPALTGATAFDPAAPRDDQAPAAVPTVRAAAVTSSRLSLSWPAATDDVGVVRYEVVLNGFQVASTAETHATVRWFNDDARDHVVQVRAVDAAGNEGPSSPNLLVARPTPAPTTTPTPEPTTTPEPTPAPSTPSPTAGPTPAPTTEPSASTEASEVEVGTPATPITEEN